MQPSMMIQQHSYRFIIALGLSTDVLRHNVSRFINIIFLIQVCTMLLLSCFHKWCPEQVNEIYWIRKEFRKCRDKGKRWVTKIPFFPNKRCYLPPTLILQNRWFFCKRATKDCQPKKKFDFSLYFWVIYTTFHHYMMLVKYVLTRAQSTVLWTWNFVK